MAQLRDGAQRGRRTGGPNPGAGPLCRDKRAQALTVALIQMCFHFIGLTYQIYVVYCVLYPLVTALWTKPTRTEATKLMPASSFGEIDRIWLQIALAFSAVSAALLWCSGCQIYATARLIKATMGGVVPSEALENVRRWWDVTIIFVVATFLGLLAAAFLSSSYYVFGVPSLYFLVNLAFFFIVWRFEKDLENRTTMITATTNINMNRLSDYHPYLPPPPSYNV